MHIEGEGVGVVCWGYVSWVFKVRLAIPTRRGSGSKFWVIYCRRPRHNTISVNHEEVSVDTGERVDRSPIGIRRENICRPYRFIGFFRDAERISCFVHAWQHIGDVDRDDRVNRQFVGGVSGVDCHDVRVVRAIVRGKFVVWTVHVIETRGTGIPCQSASCVTNREKFPVRCTRCIERVDDVRTVGRRRDECGDVLLGHCQCFGPVTQDPVPGRCRSRNW